MLQEKQELNEPPKQSTSFLVLQEILESEEKGNWLCLWTEALVPGLGKGVVFTDLLTDLRGRRRSTEQFGGHGFKMPITLGPKRWH